MKELILWQTCLRIEEMRKLVKKEEVHAPTELPKNREIREVSKKGK